MRIGIIAGFGLVLAGAATAQAADEGSRPAHYSLLGPAMCSQWPKSGSISSAAKAVPLNWALGYLGAEAGDDKLALLDLATPEAVDTYLTSYCKDHPDQNLPLAVKVLARDLESKLAPPPQAAPPEPPMFVPPTKVTPQETTTAATKAPAKKKAATAKK